MEKYILLSAMLYSTVASASVMEDCYQAGNDGNYEQIKHVCNSAELADDPHAAYLMGLAIIETQTKLSNFHLTKEESLRRIFKLESDEKIAISDAKSYLEPAAEAGHDGAEFLLGYILTETWMSAPGPGGANTKTLERADQLLIHSAEAGNSGAAMVLAEKAIVHNPDGQVINIREELFPYLKQATQARGDLYNDLMAEYQSFEKKTQALFATPETYPADEITKEAVRLLSSGLDSARSKGMRLLLIASEKGSGEANFRLGKMNEKTDIKKAFNYFEKAAEQADANAMYWLGNYYGCHKAPDKAKKWFKAATDAGHRDAIDGLEEITEYGDLSDCSASN